MAGRRRVLTQTEVQERVLVAVSTMGLTRPGPIAKQADVPAKAVKEALESLVRNGSVDQWPAIGAYKITTRGLEAVAAIESRVDTRFQWQWRSHGR